MSGIILKVIFLTAVFGSVLSGHHEHEKHHHPKPYHFGYDIKDKHGSNYRKEQSDGHGNVKGSYGYTDHHGIHREVQYVADHHGFRAKIKTNEPGTANQDPVHVQIHSHVTYHHHDVKPHKEHHGHHKVHPNLYHYG